MAPGLSPSGKETLLKIIPKTTLKGERTSAGSGRATAGPWASQLRVPRLSAAVRCAAKGDRRSGGRRRTFRFAGRSRRTAADSRGTWKRGTWRPGRSNMFSGALEHFTPACSVHAGCGLAMRRRPASASLPGSSSLDLIRHIQTRTALAQKVEHTARMTRPTSEKVGITIDHAIKRAQSKGEREQMHVSKVTCFRLLN